MSKNNLLSNRKLRISIIHNLPPGGARKLYESNLKYLRSKANVAVYKEPKFSENLIPYLFNSIIYLPAIYYPRLMKTIERKSDIILAYHSWMTKSPLCFWFTKIPIIYICHEGMREYYDKDLIKQFSIKERIIRLLRYPIALLDRYNVSKGNIVVSNSKYSKRIIDSYYKISSTVIYPGINRIKRKWKYKNTSVLKFVTIASIHKHKRIEFILSVLNEYKKLTNKAISLSIIYNDYNAEHLNSISKTAQQYFIKINLLYNISEKHKYEEISSSDLYIYAALNEPFGLGVLEALTTGIPIFAYKRGGGFTEVKANRIYLIDNLLADEWAKNIIKHYSSIASISANNHFIDSFSSETMNKSIFKIIKKLYVRH